MLAPTYIIPPLPPAVDLETVPILKALNAASRALADLKATNVASSRAVWAEFAKLPQPQSQAMLDEVYLATHRAGQGTDALGNPQ